MKTIQVQTKQPYEIQVEPGLLSTSGARIRRVTKAKTAAVITDDHVDAFYGAEAVKSLEAASFHVIKFVFPHGESSKSMSVLAQIYDFLCENNITREDCLIALGGGVVGDITGFAAATYLRGIDYVQIPTSLLAMVDSSVGGKTAVDLPGGKNLVGSFKQPIVVICDPNLLQTLPQKFLSDGMGEVIKYGMIRDHALFELLEQHSLEDIFDVIEDIILTCMQIKSDVVEHDEFDHGERMILNFGHTIAHAIESYYHYTTFTHGEAVSAGMCMMTKRACTDATYQRLCQCVTKYALPTAAPVKLSELIPFCKRDKKCTDENIRFIVCEEIGNAQIRTMPFDAFSTWISEETT